MRKLIWTIVLLVIVLAAALWLSGYGAGNRWRPGASIEVTGTSGTSGSPAEVARERGAELGAKAGEAIGRLDERLTDGALTAKIKSKMALDDYVRARDISVETSDGIVTLRGVVGSEAERERAGRLARETKGVKSVVNQIKIRQ